jgi:mono/diheme cytochrome c family protein
MLRLLPILSWTLLVATASVYVIADERTSEERGQVSDHFNADFPRLLEKHCSRCHGPDKQEAELNLTTANQFAEIEADRERWETVLKMVESAAMPPEGEPAIPNDERQQLASLLQSALFHFDCDMPADPGRVTIRRLNRAEYNNTIRDLIGLDLRPADQFPSDDVGNGFDNMGDVLSMPPLLLEKYFDAAESIAAAAITVPEVTAARQRRERDRLQAEGSANMNDYGTYAMFSEGSVRGTFPIAREGEYRIEVIAGADQGGSEKAKLQLTVVDQQETIDVLAPADDPQPYAWKLKLPAGEHDIEAAFINDFYDPDQANPAERDRNLYVQAIDLIGPLDLPLDEYPEAHRRIVTARPDDSRSRRQVRRAANQVLRPFISRAFRRPATDDEVDRYVELVQLAVNNGEVYERGLQIAITAILVSPDFLFRIERDSDPNDPQQKRSLNDYELATRLSYFLWSSMPDAELFDAAEKGHLHEADVLDQQVRRMLADPKAWELSENFAAQWLNLRNLNDVTPDPQRFPEFNEALRRDMQRESLELFAAVMREDRPITDFLDARYTFVNKRLADLYSLNVDASDDEYRRVDLTDPHRRGILTHASVLTLTSNPGRTSPVKRGKWIMENILGTPPPDPPPNVPTLDETQKAVPDLPLRKQMELHRSDAVCASCHRQMDALGFAFENYDAIGRWRGSDATGAIDASGELPSGEKFSGAAELIDVLSQRKHDFARHLSEKVLTFALGRGLQYYDGCAVDDITKRLEENEYRFSALILGIVNSDPFQMRRGEAER